MQTNTFIQQQAEKKLKHQYQLNNMNKEQEAVWGIEKSRLLCNFVGERVWCGVVCVGDGASECVCRIRVSLENVVFLWFADGTHNAQADGDDGVVVATAACCTHEFSVIFDFWNIIVCFDNKTTVIDEVYI